MPILQSRSRVLPVVFLAMGCAVAFHALRALAGVGHPALDGFVEDGIYTAIELVAVAVCGARALLRRQDRAAWALITIGLLTWSGGDLVWTIWLDGVAHPPYPSIADPLYLAMYPAMYVAIVLLLRAQFRHVGVAMWLDGVVVGLTLAAIGAALIFPAILGTSGGDTDGIALNLAYALGDMLLLVFISVAFSLSGWRPGRQWLLLALGTVVLACADMIFLYQEAKGTYMAGGILDTMWPASMMLLALAAWQPAPTGATRARGSHTVLLPVAFGVAALALLVAGSLHPLSHLALGLATAALLAMGVRAALTYVENVRMLQRQTQDAITDALTGLANRRRLMADLERALRLGRDGQATTLVLFDLNGFKRYNDDFGHGAGDALLMRLGAALARTVGDRGEAYRLGGDEFCILLAGRHPSSDALVASARAALAEHGSGFAVTASYGVVILPEDASSVKLALNLADQRMYAAKGKAEQARHSQTQSVLMQLLTEREPALHSHLCGVGTLALGIGRRFRLDSEQLDELRRAAELHDLGKLAIPDELLHKSGPLSEGERDFMRQHTIIGERILAVAPSLRVIARLVRSSHERWDGKGYPDGLAGEAIPLGARIIAACDAYDAIVSDRGYSAPRSVGEAIAELRRHAGSQFDPRVVEALCEHLQALATAGAVAHSGSHPRRAPEVQGSRSTA
jgi:two-component system cell cycle response regulator